MERTVWLSGHHPVQQDNKSQCYLTSRQLRKLCLCLESHTMHFSSYTMFLLSFSIVLWTQTIILEHSGYASPSKWQSIRIFLYSHYICVPVKGALEEILSVKDAFKTKFLFLFSVIFEHIVNSIVLQQYSDFVSIISYYF